MISTRGQEYARSGLMDSYSRPSKEAYNKTTNPTGEVNFSMAENVKNLPRFKPTTRTNSALVYASRGSPQVHQYFSPISPVIPEHITFTAGVTGLNEMVTFNLADEGEGLLLGRRVYGAFYSDMTTRTKSRLVYASFGDTDQFSVTGVKKYEECLLQARKEGIKIKALVLCNPHNPLGRCYSVDTLKALLAFCGKYDLHLVSDEIYALSVFEVEGATRTPFTSVLSIDTDGLIDPKRIHVMYGMSKDFGVAGIRLGCLISQNEGMTKATQAIGRFNWPSEISISIATTILEDTAFVTKYTNESRKLLVERYTLATETLDKAGINYSREGNAGFFLWIDLSQFLATYKAEQDGWEAEKTLKAKFSQAGVELSSGRGYMEEKPGWFRVIFTVDRDALIEGLRRYVLSFLVDFWGNKLTNMPRIIMVLKDGHGK
ncbi:putative aminotransferase gliI [Lachnellula suecica]|uniref:Putative aminotransferase gliI n=1 Tax=Lachnellula suecica TaxID=602035 RepID=A0A8T9C9U7_9HELO|nr:putative aminotransferase gliI [Lachnellula suecica]